MNKNKHILSRKFWISALISFIFILFIIPLFFTFSKDHKIVLPEGKFIKKGNRIFYNTLENLKNKNGFLVLGTSETGNGLNGQNYYHLLNKDKTINKPFLTLGGAGRCINMYFPYILDNKNVFKCLKVIYYINPTYWREGLNNYNQEYFERYVDCNLLMNSVKYDENFAKIKNFVSPPLKERTHLESLLDKFTDNFRSYYYYDLKKALLSNPDLTIKKSHSVENYYSKVELNSIKEEINQEFNVTLDFLKTKSSFPKIDKKSNYQTNQLNTFIELCKLYNIDPIFLYRAI